MIKFSFKPKQVTKKLLSILPPRSEEVIEGRFGLGPDAETTTLEAIGGKYGITRERVRQIENHALEQIKKSENFTLAAPVFVELENFLDDFGGLASEEDILAHISRNQALRNHYYLLFTLGDQFTCEKEDEHFTHRWYINPSLAEAVHNTLKSVASTINEEELISESDIIERMFETNEAIPAKYRKSEVVLRWLNLAKSLGRNPLGEWGIVSTPGIRVKGMRDYAYLSLRRHGSPMHFTEVARSINDLFGKKAHEATCHNELIKDSRFVLVGRGLYALSEWGYMGGVVKDVIIGLLRQHGPLSREEIIDKVLKERYVKANTVVVNLENSDVFIKNEDDKYVLA